MPDTLQALTARLGVGVESRARTDQLPCADTAEEESIPGEGARLARGVDVPFQPGESEHWGTRGG